mmetsp:Transcript_13825/g.34833  ORF Transcript_13825/g.34833 Transcript_13825/m.34833 type:complete len:323 (+) Transcript_13825:79-1047(+)
MAGSDGCATEGSDGEGVDLLVSAFEKTWCDVEPFHPGAGSTKEQEDSDGSMEFDDKGMFVRKSRREEKAARKAAKKAANKVPGKPGQGVQERKKYLEKKRHLRLLTRHDFNPRDVCNRLCHFVEKEDSDTFEFPPIRNSGAYQKIGFRLIVSIANVFQMKVIRLCVLKKCTVHAAVRTWDTPKTVKEKHRQLLQQIYIGWEETAEVTQSDIAQVQTEGKGKGKGKGKQKDKDKSSPRGPDDALRLTPTAGPSELAAKPKPKGKKAPTQSNEFGAFEKSTKGFGSKMLAKMGYTGSGGLGKDGQGQKDPVKVERRLKNLGIGA